MLAAGVREFQLPVVGFKGSSLAKAGEELAWFQLPVVGFKAV